MVCDCHLTPQQMFSWRKSNFLSKKGILNGRFVTLSPIGVHLIYAGFPQALEIMENLENHQKKFIAWKNHGI